MTNHPSDTELIRELQAFADEAASRVPESTAATAWIRAAYDSNDNPHDDNDDREDGTLIEMPLRGQSPLAGRTARSLGAGQVWWAGAAAALILVLALGTTLIIRGTSEQVDVANRPETTAPDSAEVNGAEFDQAEFGEAELDGSPAAVTSADTADAEAGSDELTSTRNIENRRTEAVADDPVGDEPEDYEESPVVDEPEDLEEGHADPALDAGLEESLDPGADDAGTEERREPADDQDPEAAPQPDPADGPADPDPEEPAEAQPAEPEPSVVADPTPTSTPRPTPTSTPSPVPTSTPQAPPTSTPRTTATPTPSPVPTSTPTPGPTSTPRPTPSPTPIGRLAPGNPEVFVQVCWIDVSPDGVPQITWTPTDARITQIFRTDQVAPLYDNEDWGQEIAEGAWSVNGFVDETAEVGATYRYRLVQYLESPEGSGQITHPCNLVYVTPERSDSSNVTVQVFQDDHRAPQLPPNISMNVVTARDPDNRVVAEGLMSEDGVAHFEVPLTTPSFSIRVDFENERDASCRWGGGRTVTNRPIAQQFHIRLFSTCD